MAIREDFLRPRTDRENAARRAAILDAAEALIRENHHQRFSVNEVAKRVGVSQSTIFLHFRNREELVTTLYIRVGRAFFDAFLGRLHEGMSDTAFCEAFIDAAQEHPCFRLMRPMVMRVVEECLSHEFIHVAVADIVAFRSVASARVEEVLGLTPGAEDAPVVRLLNTVFEEALKLRASDIHVEPQEKSVQIRFRIDGVLHIQTEADAKIATSLVLRLKLMSGLDISEKRLPQDGRFALQLRDSAVDVRISTVPTQFGESVVMRLLVQNPALMDLDRLEMPTSVLERFRTAIHRPSGLWRKDQGCQPSAWLSIFLFRMSSGPLPEIRPREAR